MQIKRAIKILNSTWRLDTATGFLRCTCVFLQAGPMLYTADELGAQGLGKPTVMIDVPASALTDSIAITSLEGAPIVVGHTWQTTASSDAVGAVAGRPYCDGYLPESVPKLIGDVLIRDAETARRIMLEPGDPERLEELSTGFDAQVVFAAVGEVDGHFENIRYNHVALLPAGQARGGSSVRIINEVQPMPTVHYRLPSGRKIRVENEDVAELDKEVDEQNSKAKNAIDPAKAAETLAALETAQAELTAKQKEVDSLKGELQGLKDALDKAMGAEAIDAAADEMLQQRNEATAVANAHGVTLTDEQKKLRGHGLRLAVVNAVSGAALGDDESKNEAFVSGLFKGYARTTSTPPAGFKAADPVATTQVQNEAKATPAPDMNDAAERRKRLGY